ncbi:hypothetical protein FIU85_01285 [Roseovarius sp. THAF8]|nr:hypothetical protein FIU85_01285 [Roseovarius sp. THAF8]
MQEKSAACAESALSHGVVALFARNSPGTQSPFPPEDLLESGIGIYLRGLCLLPPDQQEPPPTLPLAKNIPGVWGLAPN